MQHTIALLALIALTVTSWGCSNKLSGDFSYESESAQVSFTPDACRSGERKRFWGVDIFAEGNSEHAFRLAETRAGGFAVFFKPPGQSEPTVLSASNCASFDTHVEEQSSSVNEVTNLMGHVRLDCTLPQGKVKADVTFENCH